ncbi:hypothetical protein [Agrobacterium cavarae]|uniref:hypothetical protein n=1 Tax=Agrobacterium cavarae TaxID=2528239 RepID=UPI003FD6823F
MSSLIPIAPGQWVLAFDEPYGPFDRTMAQHLEMFSNEGGGWESHRKNEILHVYEVTAVMPKTYTIGESDTHPHAYLKSRLQRSLVIAAGSKAEMIKVRDAFFAVGVETDRRVSAEMYRRIAKFAAREDQKAVRKIRKMLPHFFGGEQ